MVSCFLIVLQSNQLAKVSSCLSQQRESRTLIYRNTLQAVNTSELIPLNLSSLNFFSWTGKFFVKLKNIKNL